MKSYFVGQIALAILLSSLVFASHEGEVEATQMTLSQSRMDAVAELTRNGGKAISISMKLSDVAHVVPAEMLKGVKEVQFGTVKFLMSFPYGGEFPDKYYHKNDFVLAFDYGKLKAHIENGKKVQVASRLRLHFSHAKGVIGFERAIPQGDGLNQWLLSSDIFGDPENPEVVVEQVHCPI